MNVAKYYAYRNLHTGNWSIMHRGLVIDHVETATLHNVEFRVRPAGHAKVLAEGRKNVHAFAVADSYTRGLVGDPQRTAVSYNPFRGPTFYRKDTGEDITKSRTVTLTPDGRVFSSPPDKW
jgi:hypothetical protein